MLNEIERHFIWFQETLQVDVILICRSLEAMPAFFPIGWNCEWKYFFNLVMSPLNLW
jgi:hypothetical protein